jgi:hypothetical protein
MTLILGRPSAMGISPSHVRQAQTGFSAAADELRSSLSNTRHLFRMSTLTATQLQQQYIAYFGRPGDPAGIKYWLSSSSGISSAREFADKIYAQDEYKKSTVGTKSTEAQVNSLYQNLFGREADAAGLIYWTGEIEAGNLTLSNIAYDLIAAASNPVAGNETQGAADALALSNKVAAATAFTADVEASTSAILAYQPETTTPWVTGAAFESGKSFLAGITTTAHTAAGIDSAVSSMISANTTAGSTVASTTSKFTTSQDVLSGGAGDDIFNGVVIGAAATGTTAQPGDQIDGGAGTDTLNISFSGAAGAAYTLEALDTDKVEKVLVSNYETGASDETTVSGSLFDSSLTTVGLSSSSTSGDTTFTGLTKLVDAEMRNGAADLTITYDSTVVSGSADTQNLTVSAVTGGTFGAANTETLSVTTELAKSKLTNISSTGLKTLNISGSESFEVVTALTTKTIDASTSTGPVTLRLGTANQTVTGGSGADTIVGGTVVTKDDTIKGGAGSDTLKLEIGNATYDGELDDELYNVSGFETIDVNSTHDNAYVELDTLWSGVTDLVAAANTKTYQVTGVADSTAITFALNGTDRVTAATDGSATAAEAATLIQGVIDALDGFTATVSTDTVTITNTGSEYLDIGVPTGGATAVTVSALKDVTFGDAAGTETLTIHTGDLVTYRLKDASGTSDVATVNIKPHADDTKFSQTIGDIDIANTETLQLGVTGLHDDYTYTLSNISGDSALTTLNITGDSNLTITDVASDNSKLVTIDASTFTNDLTFSDAAAAKQTITTGIGNDSIAFAGNLTEDDVIDLGGNTALADGTAGTDTVTATGNLGTSVDDSVLQISNVETFQLNVGGAAATYIDASKLVNTNNLAFSATSGTVKIKNLGADATIGIGVGAVEFGNTTTATLDVALADETGTADSITLDASDGAINAAQQVTFKSTGIETLNIKASKDSTNDETTTFTFGENAPSKIVVTDGQAADTLALGTLNTTTTEVDAGAYKGILTLTGASAIDTTVSANAAVNNSITTSTGNDTVTLKGDLGNTDNTVAMDTGTDVLNILSLSATDTDFQLVSGVETINFTVKDSTTAGFDADEDTGLQTATTLNFLGGNALSKFNMTTATIDDNAIDQKLDSSTFAGTVEHNFASNAFDANITVVGGVATDDKVSIIIADTANKPASMTGIETLSVTSTNDDLDASVDLTNVSGLTTLEATYTGTAGDQIEVDKLADGVTVKVTGAATTPSDPDVLDLGLTNASSATTSASIEITTFAGTDDKLDIDAVGVETLNLNNKGGAATNQFDLAGVTATTGSDSKLVLTGLGGTLKALSSSFNEVDATGTTSGVTLAAADRPATAMTINTSTGADSIGMEHSGDVINAGTGTDTLTITAKGVLGGFAVDLSSTTDQVTQFAGVANAGAQIGFENVSGSGITGTFGLDVTGSTGANEITGSSNADILRGGKGIDTFIQTAGVDELQGDAGADVFSLKAIFPSSDTTATIDVIKDFAVGSDTLTLSLADIESSGGITDLTGADAGASLVDTSALTIATISGAVDLDTINAPIIAVSHATAWTESTLLTGLVASGNVALTMDQARGTGDGILIVYDDNTDSYLASLELKTANVADGATIISGNAVLENLVKFEGISDATTFTSADFNALTA